MHPLSLTFDRAPRFVLLLLLILLELMVTPLFVGSELGLRAAQAVVGGVVMIAALWAAAAKKAAIVFFVPALAAQLFFSWRGGPELHEVALGLRVVFFGYATGLIMWHIMRSKAVTIDTIAGAACVYTLLAVVWACLYQLLEVARPGSFIIPAIWRMGPAGDATAALAYFSFATLTTVGYGDIVPAWPGAGGLAAAEAVVGQLYLAITIARLVGLHTSQRS